MHQAKSMSDVSNGVCLHLARIATSIVSDMVSTRSKKNGDTSPAAETGDKRAAPNSSGAGGNKKPKTTKEEPGAQDGKLQVGKDGEVGLKKEEESREKVANDTAEDKKKTPAGEQMDQTREEMKAKESAKAEKGQDEVDQKSLQGIKGELEEPKHGQLAFPP